MNQIVASYYEWAQGCAPIDHRCYKWLTFYEGNKHDF